MDNNLQERIAALAKSHPTLNEEKTLRRMSRIDRMTDFYRDKMPEAPQKQALLFSGFVSALLYASTVIKMYRKLTKDIAELAEEASDENRLSS